MRRLQFFLNGRNLPTASFTILCERTKFADSVVYNFQVSGRNVPTASFTFSGEWTKFADNVVYNFR